MCHENNIFEEMNHENTFEDDVDSEYCVTCGLWRGW